MPTITHIKIQNSAESYEIGSGGATILNYAACTIGEVVTAFQEGPVYLEMEDASTGKVVMTVSQAWSSGSAGVICITGSYGSDPENGPDFTMSTLLVGGNLTDTIASGSAAGIGIEVVGGNMTIVDASDLTPFNINVNTPTENDHAANKKYVDDQIAALQATIASLQSNALTELDRQTLDVLENKSTS